MDAMARKRRTWSSRMPVALSVISIALLASLVGIWAARANISGAVIGTGTIEVSSTMTAVQHPIGGVVEEIRAFDGDNVTAGDVIVRLEDTQLQSDLNVVEGSLYEILANMAWLEAAIDGRQEMTLYPALEEAAKARPDVNSLVERKKRQLFAHFEAIATEARLLDEQISQVKAQISGLDAQLAAKRAEKTFSEEELERLDTLAGRGLVKQSERFLLLKNMSTIEGELGKLEAQSAELRGRISEIELKRHMIVPKERKLAVAELSKLRPERTKFLERRSSLLERLTRLEIRAPISGKIHDSKVLGIKSVVVAAKPLMMIVPDSDPGLVLVRIDATDIDQVYPRQEASLKFKAFNGRHIPLIIGEVSSISADVFKDPLTRRSYYEVTLTMNDAELAKLGERDLLPGMPVEAFLSTESRTPLNYVLQPLLTYFDRAFRDA